MVIIVVYLNLMRSNIQIIKLRREVTSVMVKYKSNIEGGRVLVVLTTISIYHTSLVLMKVLF